MSKTWMWLGIALFAAGLTLAGCGRTALAPANGVALAAAPAAEATPQPRLATVNGVGRVTLSPDMATVQVGVRTEDPDVGRAVSKNIRRAQAIYAAVQALGVAEKDLQTTGFNVYKTTKGPQENRVEVYVAENTVSITVRDLDLLGQVIGAALDAGANQVRGLRFGASNYADALAQARRQALEDAQAQARLMAEVLGMRLGPPRRVSFGGGQPVPRADVAYKAMAPEAAPPEVPVAAGELEVTATAFVEFELLEP